MTSLDFVNLVTTIEFGALGLTFYVAPDYFWNPQDGLFRTLGFITKTQLESNHLGFVSQLNLRNVGANFLGVSLTYFILQDEADTRILMKLKIAMFATLLIPFFYNTFVLHQDTFGKRFLLFATAFKVAHIWWCAKALLQSKPIPTAAKPTTPERAPSLVSILVLGYTLIWTTFFGALI